MCVCMYNGKSACSYLGLNAFAHVYLKFICKYLCRNLKRATYVCMYVHTYACFPARMHVYV